MRTHLSICAGLILLFLLICLIVSRECGAKGYPIYTIAFVFVGFANERFDNIGALTLLLSMFSDV